LEIRLGPGIAKEAQVFVEPVREAVRTPLSMLLFVRELGIELSGLVNEAAVISARVQQIDQVIRALPTAADTEFLDLALDLFEAVRELAESLHDVLATDLGPEDAQELRQALEYLPLYLIVRYLDARLPWLSAVFRGLGWVDRAPTAACIILRVDRIRASMNDFSGSLAELYAWGPGETWDRVRLFDALSRVAVNSVVQASWAGLPPEWVSAGFLDAQHADGYHRLQLGVLPRPQQVGVQLAPFPRTPTGPLEGLWLSPFSTALGAELDIGPLRIGLPLNLSALPAGVAVFPGGDLQVMGRFPSSAAFSLSLVEPVNAGPVSLMGVEASVGFAPEGPSAAVSLTNGGLGFTIPAGDGFLEAALPNGVQFEMELSASYDPEFGLQINGAVGTEVFIQPKPSKSPVQLSWLRARLGLGTDGFEIDATGGVTVRLGAVEATIEGMGAGFSVGFPDEPAGPWSIEPSLVAPTGIGFVVGKPDSGVHGGGFLSFEEDRYAGAMTLHIGDLALDALGLLTTGEDWTLLVMVNASFPGIALGYGFFLTGIGGLLALNRDLDIGALDEGLSDGVLDSLLFPENTVTDATRILNGLERIFPAAPGRFSGGLFAQISYGMGSFWVTEVGLLISVPNPLRVALVGTSTLRLPPKAEKPIGQIQLAVLGAYDGGSKVLLIRADLVDSHLGPLKLRGGALFRASFGSNPSFILSIGGFHPEFTPPAGVVPPERIGADLNLGILRLYLGAYFAVTPNTIQFGAHVRVEANLAIARIRGEFRVDALIQLSPLSFSVDLLAEVALETPRGRPLLVARVELLVTGPRPMAVEGEASITILGIPATVRISGQSDGRADDSAMGTVDPLMLVADALDDLSAWTVAPDPALELAPNAVAGSQQVVVQQKVLPLDQPLEHLNSHGTGGDTPVELTSATHDISGVEAPFATASYRKLTDDEALRAPAFTPRQAGAAITSRAVEQGGGTRVSPDRVVRVRQDGTAVTGTIPPRPEAA